MAGLRYTQTHEIFVHDLGLIKDSFCQKWNGYFNDMAFSIGKPSCRS